MTMFQVQANLNKGELDPTLRGRQDTDIYYNGLEKARNVLLTPQVAAKKRPGTRYLHTFPAGFEPTVLKTFSFNQDVNYTLAFHFNVIGSRIYIFKNGVLQTNINGSGDDYLTFLNLTSEGGFYYIQSANTAIIFNNLDAPARITRTSDTQWSVSTINFSRIPQYDFNDSFSPTPADEVHSLTFTNVNASDRLKLSIDDFLSDEISWSSDTSENANRIEDAIQGMANTASSGVSVAFSAGTTYTITFGGESAGNYGLIQGLAVVTQSTSFSAESTVTTPGASRKENVISALRGWPRTGVFHQNRLWLGGTTALPDSLFASVVGDFFNLDQGKARDDEGIFVTLQTDQVNRIQALVSSRKLQVFTTGSEFYAPLDVITPSNVRFEVSTNYGAKNVSPVVLDGSVIFPQREGRALVLVDIANQYQAIQSRNIGVLAPHLLNNVREMALSRGNEDTDANYIYCLNSDGSVACLNYLVAESVEGFSLWETNGTINSIAVTDQLLYTLVTRGSSTMLEVEDEALQVDSGVVITSSSTVDTSHYSGTIEVVGDGAYLGEFTSGASVTLPRTVTSGFAGVSFRPTLKTMPLIMGMQDGPNYAKKKRIRRAIIQFYLSNGVVVNDQRIPDRTIGLNQFDAPIPFTGIKRVKQRGYDIERQLEVTQTTPMPFYILSIGAEMRG